MKRVVKVSSFLYVSILVLLSAVMFTPLMFLAWRWLVVTAAIFGALVIVNEVYACYG